MLRMGPRLTPDARLLVRLPSWLGDLVMAEPTLRALHELYAAAGVPERLTLAGPAHLLPLLDGALRGARRLPHDGRGGERVEDWRGHDAALLLTNSFRSAWTAWRAGIPRRVGWARDGRGWLLTDTMRPARERGGVPLGCGVKGRGRRYLPRPFGATCVELVGLLGVSVADTHPRLRPTEEAVAAMDARLTAGGVDPTAPFALANVGARPGSAKAYPPGSWSAALEALSAASELPLVLVGGPGEEEAVRAVAVRGATVLVLDDPVVDLAGLAALCARARVVLTADCGPRHVAVAVGTPVAVVLGPTDPRHTADHLGTTNLVREEVPCGPCHHERCPLVGDDHHCCMRGVAPKRFAHAALALLPEASTPSTPRRPTP